uniref:Si:ch211-237i5.4 n=1 Tax=Labrus bergylta TaxID=56723 RepID=A0A3Q3H2Q9_9LABR
MSLLFPPFLFFLLAFLSPPSLLPSVEGLRLCPYKCMCYEHADLVDCHSRGFEHVPRGLPHGTWLLELGGNNLSEICTRAFTGLWSLRVLVLTNSFFLFVLPGKLDLSWNQLTSLPVDFSTSLSAIRELRLEHNNLHHISGYRYLSVTIQSPVPPVDQDVMVTSQGLSRLRQLYLHNNRLTVVQHGSLDMLPGLEMLQLSNNNISQIDSDALAPLYSLAVLALDGNNLHHLKFKTFISLHTTATHIQLSGNPWSCDCELHRVFSKILHVRHLHIDDYRNVTCRDPPQLAGASLAWVDSQLCVAETATVLVITVTVLVTVVAALVMAERTRKRNRGKNWETESQAQT